MTDENRVLGRVGARELSPEEVDCVSAGFRTIHFTQQPCGPTDFVQD
jgi:hypothetical protein